MKRKCVDKCNATKDLQREEYKLESEEIKKYKYINKEMWKRERYNHHVRLLKRREEEYKAWTEKMLKFKKILREKVEEERRIYSVDREKFKSKEHEKCGSVGTNISQRD